MSSDRDLRRLQSEVVTSQLLSALDSTAEAVARARSRTENADVPIPLLEALTNPGAPGSAAARLLRRRVDAGDLTWVSVWTAPAEYDGGVALVQAVVAAQIEATRSNLEADPMST